MANSIKCEANRLKLFLAKKNDTWLSSKDDAAISMRSGEIPEEIQTLLSAVEMDPVDLIEDLFGNLPKSTIHVLVELPKGTDSMSVPVARPLGRQVDSSSCDDLLEFLESEMNNKEKIASKPHLLEADSLQFRLVGREDAISTAANCFKEIIEANRTTGSDRTSRPMPLCSGMSGLGKTRMLEECCKIFQEMKLDPKHVFRVIVPYSNGFDLQPVEDSMPIEASFSWRLLYRFLLDKNCAFSFADWFRSRLPRNGRELRFSDAIAVIERKLRQSVEAKELYLFLGVDDFQKIKDLNAA